jgi:hypothetical protein
MLPVFQGKARELCRVMEQDMNADANKIVDGMSPPSPRLFSSLTPSS